MSPWGSEGQGLGHITSGIGEIYIKSIEYIYILFLNHVLHPS